MGAYLHIRVVIGILVGRSLRQLWAGRGTVYSASRPIQNILGTPVLGRICVSLSGSLLVVGIPSGNHHDLDVSSLLRAQCVWAFSLSLNGFIVSDRSDRL